MTDCAPAEIVETCDRCDGRGRLADAPCGPCNASGRVARPFFFEESAIGAPDEDSAMREWISVAKYYLGDYALTHTGAECRAEAFRRSVEADAGLNEAIGPAAERITHAACTREPDARDIRALRKPGGGQ